MNNPSHTKLRRGVYVLLVCVATGVMLGRILAVDAVDRRAIQDARINRLLAEKERAINRSDRSDEEKAELLASEEKRIREAIVMERPFLSANDRSRLATVRALVDPEMRVEGVPYAIDKVIQEPGWDTIDMVKHDGHLYSSKPPLYPTFLAGQYWVIRDLTGWTLGDNPFLVGRILLVLNNIVPLLIYFAAVGAMIERLGRTDWGRLFAFSGATFGTFLTTFAVTINNHVPAAACAAVALWALLKIWLDGNTRAGLFLLAGLAAALMAANELPALALLGLLSLVLLYISPARTLLVYTPAVLLVAAGFFGTNWIAHHTLKPAYMHRHGDENWYDYTYEVRRGDRVRTIESYWRNPQHVDRGEASLGVYAMNVLVGHHGIFSLTPMWILSVIGALLWFRRGEEPRLRVLAGMVALVTLVALAFYLTREGQMRNYGGMTSGLRWMFWLAPAWLLLLLPTVDRMARNPWLKGLALVTLIASVVSAAYPVWNPWSEPWLMHWFRYLGWL